MSFGLRPGVSFCRADDRLVFLDLSADRYFCLSEPIERSFARLVERGHGDVSSDLIPLRRSGILTEQPGCAPLAPCTPPQVPEASLLDAPLPHVSTPSILAALGSLASSRTRLKLLGLRRSLAAIGRGKAKLREPGEAEVSKRLLRTVAAFRGAEGIVSALDNCLTRSVAVSGRLLRQGVSTNVVIGVRLGPFNAHCWVQREGYLVNDRFDMVRMFTPILVI
ncbi:lasso peptide biosynthesis B2 protein [Sphingomonas cannabina]|uniref:lasso peptide biosynthesis B2 protein n=1 Tax=Sphingomonas cannabina TaxID=2899123 RepID=UPI001F33D967|nr:lasso peptide biosynthesis B2 protein [Sphingomonas cannabina]UIJ46345.1 lasso peptide biosynthesis B2 protein [Sphingomonas cannabina]